MPFLLHLKGIRKEIGLVFRLECHKTEGHTTREPWERATRKVKKKVQSIGTNLKLKDDPVLNSVKVLKYI